MFSQTTEYALRAMVMLSSDTERSWKTTEIAKFTKVPADYLSKVLQALSRAGLVVGSRGGGGGFRLAQKPESLSILSVINAVDPLPRIHKCPLGLKSHGTNLCPLHKRLDKAMEMAESAFASSTLAELVATEKKAGASRPCDFPLLTPKVPNLT